MQKGETMQVKIPSMPPVEADTPGDEPEQGAQHFFVEGSWLPAADPLTIGPDNFSAMQNLRFGQKILEGVPGYSGINSNPRQDYPKIRSGIHFSSPTSGQSRCVVQAWNEDMSASAVLEQLALPPAPGDFEATPLHTDAAGAGLGRFALWPRNQIAYCNGKEAMIYGGDEVPAARFMTSTASVSTAAPRPTNPKDYSQEVRNTRQDADQIAVIGGGLDGTGPVHGGAPSSEIRCTVLCIHADGALGSTTLTDSSIFGHTITATAGAAIDTNYPYFGTGCIYFGGSAAFLSMPDSDAWALGGAGGPFGSAEPFVVDMRLRWTSLPTDGQKNGLWGQWQDADNWIACTFGNTAGQYYLSLRFCVAGAVTSVLTANLDFSVAGGLQTDRYYHLALIHGWASDPPGFMVTIDGKPACSVAVSDGEWPNYTGVFMIGKATEAGTSYYFPYGRMDEFRISKNIYRWTEEFRPPARAYSTAALTFLVFSTRPVRGGTFYIVPGQGNKQADSADLILKEWNGASWEQIDFSDGTLKLSQTGKWSCRSTVGTSVPKYIEGQVLYAYQFNLSIGEAEIYHVTLDCPWQPVCDVWDGTEVVLPSVLVYNSAAAGYKDFTIQAADPSPMTVVTLNALATNEYLLLGSPVPLMGFNIRMSNDAAKVNDTANTALTLAYCNGDAIASWPAARGLDNGTAVGGGAATKSLKQTGVVSFTPVGAAAFPVAINGGAAYYYYKLSFAAALSASVEAIYITGIPAPRQIGPYTFPFLLLGRPMLCGDKLAGEGNRIDFAMTHAPDVWNGPDSSFGIESEPLYIGQGDLTGAVEVYNRLGPNIYTFAIFCSDYETHLVNGLGTSAYPYRHYPLSTVLGCPAPLTMDTWQIGISADGQAVRSVAMWVTHQGPVIFDSGGLQLVPGLECYFDPRDSRCVNFAALSIARGHFDPDNGHYHVELPSGAGQTTNNLWVAWQPDQKKWYPVVPSAPDGYLGAAFRVADTAGKNYVYGGRDNGQLMRLHHGATWDGSPQVQSVTTGDFLPSKSIWDATRITGLKMIALSAVEDVSLTPVLYADGAAAGTTLAPVPMKGAKRYVRHSQGVDVPAAWSWRLQWSAIVNTETQGLRLIAWGVKHQIEWEDQTNQ
jgi:hypothetical protein